MNDEKLKSQIGANIALYRKNAGLTQAGLAAKLNYSDKAISKWERGESIPDVITLLTLAEQFEITVNDLLADPNALPEDGDPGKLEKAMSHVSEKALKRKANKNVILMLSLVVLWTSIVISSGRLMLLSALRPRNACFGIAVTPSGTTTFFSELHPVNGDA